MNKLFGAPTGAAPMRPAQSIPAVRVPPRRGLRFAALLVGACLGLVASFLILETGLRLRPELFGRTIQNLAFSKYDDLPDGIYVWEPQSRVNFLRRSFSTRLCHNGYCWDHRSDRLGFRNPEDVRDKSVLLLGDSLIYGHGVEETQTLTHILREELGRPVYNMSRQADSLYKHYVLLRLHLERLRPRLVVLFVFINDFRDLERTRSAKELELLPEIHHYDYAAIGARAARAAERRPSWLGSNLFRLHSIRLVASAHRLFRQKLERLEWMPIAEAAGKGKRTSVTATINDPRRFGPLARYYREILNDLNQRSNDLGCRLALVHLDLAKKRGRRHARAKSTVQSLLESLSRELDLLVLDTEQVFRGCRQCFLAADGHLSEEGHRRLALFLDQALFSSE